MSMLSNMTSAGNGQLRAAVFYAQGQALGGVRKDPDVILGSLRAAGLESELVNLVDLQDAGAGAWLLRNPDSGLFQPWARPDVALMYHGAIAPEGSATLLTSLERQGTPVINGAESWQLLTDKHAFAEEMGARGVRVIDTVRVHDLPDMQRRLTELGGEAVFKPAVSTEGEGVYVVRSADELREVARELQPASRSIIAQPLIDSRIGSSLEPAIFDKVAARVHARTPDVSIDTLAESLRGRRIEFRVHTTRHADGSVEVPATYARAGGDEHQVVNNVAQGAIGAKIDFTDLDPRDQQAILDAARAMPKSGDIAGWDLIGQPGSRRIIEGNSGPGLPDPTEGFIPDDVVRGYGTLLSARARETLGRVASPDR